MLSDFLLFYPIGFTLAMMLTTSLVIRPRRTLGFLLIVPLLPFYVIRRAAMRVVNFCDWIVEDRAWTRFILRATQRLGLHP